MATRCCASPVRRPVANFPVPRELLKAGAGTPDGLGKPARARIEALAQTLRESLDRGERPAEARPLSRLEIEVVGQLPGGAPFRRLAIRTVPA